MKTEPIPTFNINRTSLSWDVLSSDSIRLSPSWVKSDEKLFIANIADKNKDSGDADGASRVHYFYFAFCWFHKSIKVRL